MMRSLCALAALCLSACASECNVTEATGLFEIFKTAGCITSTSGHGSALDAMSFSQSGNTVIVDGVDAVAVHFDDRLYAGRRGACSMADEDALVNENEHGHCDYVIRSFDEGGSGQGSYTVEILDAYLAVYGQQGTMKGIFTVTIYDLGGTP